MNCSLTAKFLSKSLGRTGGKKTSVLVSVKGICDYLDGTAIRRKKINNMVT